MDVKQFKDASIKLVDMLANYLASVDAKPISVDIKNADLKDMLAEFSFGEKGDDLERVFRSSISLLQDYSFSGNHARQWGYILPTVDPISSLAEFIIGVFNQNLGGWEIAPIATEIESQSIRWLADFIGFDSNCAGTFVSGGNVANFTAMLCARQRKLRELEVQKLYENRGGATFTIYVSVDTHTWIDKSIDLFGFSRRNLRLIGTDTAGRMDVIALADQIAADTDAGFVPLIVVATAGTTSTGAVDPIFDIAKITACENIWLHIDGAYGAPAASLSELDWETDAGGEVSAFSDLKSLNLADSLAIDPHKWLYTSYESGCILVKDAVTMRETFTYVPKYYGNEDDVAPGEINYYQFGLQNSRNFKALKVWLQLRILGREAIRIRIKNDIFNACYLYNEAEKNPQLQAWSRGLSVVTFRFCPSGLSQFGSSSETAYVNNINEELLDVINKSGEFYFSHTESEGVFLLRACFVNLKSCRNDIDAAIATIVSEGNKLMQRKSCTGVTE